MVEGCIVSDLRNVVLQYLGWWSGDYEKQILCLMN